MPSDDKFRTLVSSGEEGQDATPRTLRDGTDGCRLTLAEGVVVDGRFRIEDFAAQGGMGDVFRATDLVSGRSVALKTLRGNVEMAPRLQREADCLRRLNHPSIPAFVASGTLDAGCPYLVSEWSAGVPLEQWLPERRLSLAAACGLMRRIASAVAAAHDAGIVHRDLSPSNLLVGCEREQVWILDFGVAALDSSPAVLTRTGSQLGTPGFMAPEQIEGDTKVGPTVDVFALGCLLYELCSNQRAFQGETVQAVFARVLRGEPRSLGELRPDCPDELLDLIDRLLAKQSSERPGDANQVLEELDALPVLADVTPEDEPPKLRERGEQRVVGVVVVPAQEGDLLSKVRQVASSQGLLAAPGEDGIVLVTSAGSGPASDHAIRAARCALALRRVARLPQLSLATGLARIEHSTPTGRAVDAASVPLSLSGTSVPGGCIHLDENTAGLLDARFDVRRVDGGFQLHGLRTEVEPARTILGRRPRCVGRRREISLLEATLSESVEERMAGAILITGGPGIGKTRLAHELAKCARRSREVVEVLRGGGDAMTRGIPFSSLASALERTARISEGDSAEARREKLEQRLRPVLGEAEFSGVCDALGGLIGAEARGAGVHPLPETTGTQARRQENLSLALEGWLRAETTRRPVLLILDDLHDGDLATANLVDALLRKLADQPFLVVALARPEVHDLFPGLWVKRGVTELRLSGLTRRATLRMVEEIIGEEVSAVVRERVLERAQGNPFWVEELLRAEEAGEGEDVPDRVLLLAQSRIAALGADARWVLRTCSVFGRRFWWGAANWLAQDGRDAISFEAIEKELLEAEMLHPCDTSRFGDEVQVEFASGLLRDAAYSLLSVDEREFSHRSAGEWLEEKGSTEALTIATHYTLGGEVERAHGYYLKAATAALAENDFDAAIACAEEGLSGTDDCDELAFRLILAEAHKWRGDNVMCFRAAQGALAKAGQGTPEANGAMGMALGAAQRLGRYQECQELATQLVEEDGPLTRERAIALERASAVLASCGRVSLARRLLGVVDTQNDSMQPDPLAGAFAGVARSALANTNDDPRLALELLERAADDFEDAGELREASAHRLLLADMQMQSGQLAAALASIEVGLGMAESMGLPSLVVLGSLARGSALFRAGHAEEGASLVAAAADTLEQQRNVQRAGLARVQLAEMLLSDGSLDFAEDAARRAVALLADHPYWVRPARAMLALVLLEEGAVDEALSQAEQAVEGLPIVGRLPYGQTLVWQAFAEVLVARGRAGEADEIIAREAARLSEIIAGWSCEDVNSFLGGAPSRQRVLELAEHSLGEESGSQGRYSGTVRASSATISLNPVTSAEEQAGRAERAIRETKGSPVLQTLLLARCEDEMARALQFLIDNEALTWPAYARWESRDEALRLSSRGRGEELVQRCQAKDGSLEGVGVGRAALLRALGLQGVLRVAAQKTVETLHGELLASSNGVSARLAMATAKFVDLMRTDPSEEVLGRFITTLGASSVEEPSAEAALGDAFQHWGDAAASEYPERRHRLVRMGNLRVAYAKETLLQEGVEAAARASVRLGVRRRLATLLPPLFRALVTPLVLFLGAGFIRRVADVWKASLPEPRIEERLAAVERRLELCAREVRYRQSPFDAGEEIALEARQLPEAFEHSAGLEEHSSEKYA